MQLTDTAEELYYQLALTFVPGIGDRTGRALLEHYHSATHVFRAPLKELTAFNGINEAKAKGFRDAEVLKRAEQELAFVEKNDVQVACINDANYPTRLANCLDAPLVLYHKGSAPLSSPKMVAIVGTRKSTDYGTKLCEELVEYLQTIDGVTVMSGLALGIDATAHKKAVQLGISTIGVLGHGLDRIYPHTHRALATQMEENGGILAEFPSNTLPDRNNFPMRNRIVAGMSDITIVVESQVGGGAIITAKMAASYNREVAAYPGRVNDSRSAGCNELIRTNMAAMITRGEDLVQLMGWDERKKPAVQQKLFITLTPEEQRVIDVLQTKDKLHADELFHASGLSNSTLAATLLQLEMQGIIKSLPGKYYRMY